MAVRLPSDIFRGFAIRGPGIAARGAAPFLLGPANIFITDPITKIFGPPPGRTTRGAEAIAISNQLGREGLDPLRVIRQIEVARKSGLPSAKARLVSLEDQLRQIVSASEKHPSISRRTAITTVLREISDPRTLASPAQRGSRTVQLENIASIARGVIPKPKRVATQVVTAAAPKTTDSSIRRAAIDTKKPLIKALPAKETKTMGLFDIALGTPTILGALRTGARTIIGGGAAIIPGILAEKFLSQPGQRIAGPIDLGVDIVKRFTNGRTQPMSNRGLCFDQQGNLISKPRRKRTILSVRDVQGANRVCKVVKRFGFKPKVNTCRKRRKSC